MKKLLFAIVLFLMFIPSVNAANICTATKYNNLKAKAFNVNLSYELKFDANHKAYFEVTVMNMTEDLILVFNNVTYEVKDNNPFLIQTRLEGGNSYNFNFYGGYNGPCVEEFIYTKTVRLPVYNVYSEREECIEYEEFPLCNKWYQKEIVSDNAFLDALELYKESLNKKDPVDLDEDNRNIFQKIFDFYMDSLLLQIVSVVLIIGIIYVVVKKSIDRKKRVKIDNDEFKL